MIPAVPSANPPFQSIVETLGFHSPHVDMSDQIFQTLSAEAVDSTEVPDSAIVRSFLCTGDGRLSHTTTNRPARNRPADQEPARDGRSLEHPEVWSPGPELSRAVTTVTTKTRHSQD